MSLNDRDKIALLADLVERRRHDGSHEPHRALALLVEEGIVDELGGLTREYGGVPVGTIGTLQ